MVRLFQAGEEVVAVDLLSFLTCNKYRKPRSKRATARKDATLAGSRK